MKQTSEVRLSSMSDNDNRILLGRISGAHGIRGEVAVQSYAETPEAIAAYGPLVDETGERQFVLKPLRMTSKALICRVEGISDRNGAEALKGVGLYVERERLPPAEDGSYYHTDLIGLVVVDETGAEFGAVAAVLNFGAGDLLEVSIKGRRTTEIVPFTNACVPEVDLAGRKIVVILPESGDAEPGEEGPRE